MIIFGKKNKGCHVLAVLLVMLASWLALDTIPIGQVQAQTTPSWYRIRTNSVPYQPTNVIVDQQGQVWVTDVNDYEPGIWRQDTTAPGGFTYITNNANNNKVGANYLQQIIKPRLNVPVQFINRDSAGNTWYAFKDTGVACEKADGSWIYFNNENTPQMPSDPVQRIRFLKSSDGTQITALISYAGITCVGSNYQVSMVRYAATMYNNDMIKDILLDSQGRYWVASNRGIEMSSTSGGERTIFNTSLVTSLFPGNQSVPGANEETPISRIEEDKNGNIWSIANSYGSIGIYCYDAAGEWNKYDQSNCPISSYYPVDLATDSSGKVWIGLSYGDLLEFTPADQSHNATWKNYDLASWEIESDAVVSLAVNSTGVWFVSGYNSSVPGNGTGVHCFSFDSQGQAQVSSYDYRGSSTTLTCLRYEQIAADKSGGVWFPAYDDGSIARLKSDGTWQQYRSGLSGRPFDFFGIPSIGVDSHNIVYITPTNSIMQAYDVNQEQWIKLPDPPDNSIYPYGIYIDPQDGKWIYAAYGVYYLNPDNSAWTKYTVSDGLPSEYIDTGVLMDGQKNVWFMGRDGVSVMKAAVDGQKPVWVKFTYGDSYGFAGGYIVYTDNKGEIWNAAKQKYNYTENKWEQPTDTSSFDHRSLVFLNGTVPADLDLSQAQTLVSELNQEQMTVDSQGKIYFAAGISGGIYAVDAGIVVYDSQQQGNSTISPNAADFSKNSSSQQDINITLQLNGNTLSSITNGTTTMQQGTDYTVSGNTVTIKKEYFATQAVGTTILTFKFSSGTAQTLTINVMAENGASETWTDWPAIKQKSSNDFWTITFNKDVDSSSVNTANIYVTTDESGINQVNGISVTPLTGNARQVKVAPPTSGWQSGEIYYLFISNRVKATTGGQTLQNGVRMKFNVNL